ncbi:MAG: CesT family type III secretion system chaperone [Puniceicoccales bacterium]|jgi:hypothetical protein|nr:CesT family type III secretion system chaperone [Puniceicoccales bacterium]
MNVDNSVDKSFALRKTLAEYIDSASSRMKSELKLGSNGICAFKHDKSGMEFAIELPEDSDIVYFYSPICRVPYDFTEHFFEKLLENNLHGVANNQASFGLDKKTQSIVLSYSIPIYHLDTVAFENILFNFITTAEKAARNTMKWLDEIVAKHTFSGKKAEGAANEVSEKISMRA